MNVKQILEEIEKEDRIIRVDWQELKRNINKDKKK